MHEIWSAVSQENHRNCCHEMSHFKAKMHQIRFRLGLRPRPRWGAYSAPLGPLAGFKTRLQGAFGECVDADLVILKVRLKPDTFNCTNAINTESIVMSIPIVFALTDALASKHCDMLLPMHDVMELRRHQNLCVVCPDQCTTSVDMVTGENVLNVMAADDTVKLNTGDSSVDVENNVCNNKVDADDNVLTDNESTDSDDDLSQDRDADFDNAYDLLMKVVNQDNMDQFIKEQRDDLSLKPFWDMAEKHKGGIFVKNGLLYHQKM